MSDKMMKTAMGMVLEDMGRAAREGRARRFNRKRGEEQPRVPSADIEVDDVKVSPEEMDELLQGLEVQR